MQEFELIRRFFQSTRHPTGHPTDQRNVIDASVVRGPGDDGAVLTPEPGRELVMTTDTQVEGRHFPADLPVVDIGWRSLAVNLSDLAAMGADPRWCLLTLSMPVGDEAWLSRFCEGFFELAGEAGITLVGGDMVRGPLAVTVQAVGDVPVGQALLRDGAGPGDRLCISGVPGESAAGLLQWQAGVRQGELVTRFARPRAELDLGRRLRGCASACIDVSDGLLADLGHVLEASGCGVELDCQALPVSDALRAWRERDQVLRTQLSGGDDYLLVFALPAGQPLPGGCHVIGRFEQEPGLRVRGPDGQWMSATPDGFDHFAD